MTALNGRVQAFEERQRELTRMATRVQAFREGGDVQRAHTLPHFGSYDVGKHSFGALCLLLVLHPGPSPMLMKAVLLHDAAERWVGDSPSPALAASMQLKLAYVTLEAHVLVALGVPLGADLSEEDIGWLSAVDKLECMLWAREQMAMGNQRAAAYVQNVVAWINQHADMLPLRAVEYCNYVHNTQPLCLRLQEDPNTFVEALKS